MPDYNNKLSLFELIFKLCKVDKKDLLSILIYALIIGIFSLILPLAIQEIVNIIAFGVLVQPLIILTLVLVFFLIIIGFFEAIQFYIVEILQQKLYLRYFSEIYELLRKHRKKCEQHHKNSTYEIFLLHKGYQKILAESLVTAFGGIISLIAMAFYHYYFALIAVLIFFFIYLALYVFGRNGIKTAYRESNCKYDLFDFMQSEDPLSDHQADELSFDYLNARMDHFDVLMRQKIMIIIIGIISNTTVLGLGGLLVIENKLGLGQLVAAEIMLNKGISSLNKISYVLNTFFDLMINILKVEKLRLHLRELEEEATEI